ncbi:MAG: hypothetical protein JOZ39_08780 [Chloroflexi bacterium]|nr:hypothetical protein [Chloroflexota bacterium]
MIHKVWRIGLIVVGMVATVAAPAGAATAAGCAPVKTGGAITHSSAISGNLTGGNADTYSLKGDGGVFQLTGTLAGVSGIGPAQGADILVKGPLGVVQRGFALPDGTVTLYISTGAADADSIVVENFTPNGVSYQLSIDCAAASSLASNEPNPFASPAGSAAPSPSASAAGSPSPSPSPSTAPVLLAPVNGSNWAAMVPPDWKKDTSGNFIGTIPGLGIQGLVNVVRASGSGLTLDDAASAFISGAQQGGITAGARTSLTIHNQPGYQYQITISSAPNAVARGYVWLENGQFFAAFFTANTTDQAVAGQAFSWFVNQVLPTIQPA